MTTPNHQPTPPPGCRLLMPEEYTEPAKPGLVFWNFGEWCDSTLIVGEMIENGGLTYAIPITPTVPANELEIPPEVAAEVDRTLDEMAAYREKTKDVNAGTYAVPATGDTSKACPVCNAEMVLVCNATGDRDFYACATCDPDLRALSGDTTNEKGSEQRQELEEVHQIIRDAYSALHVDSEQISERMARDIIKHAHKGMDEALDIIDRIIRVMKRSEESSK